MKFKANVYGLHSIEKKFRICISSIVMVIVFSFI